MARNRMIKTEFWGSKTLAKVSRDARLTFIAMWNFADDYGAVKANIKWLIGNLFESDDSVTPELIKKWLNELTKEKLIIPYSVENRDYFFIHSWKEHQRVDKPSAKRLPPIPREILESYSRNEIEIEKEIEIENNTSLSCKQDEIKILNHLNLKSGKNFKPIESNFKFIRSRLKDYSINELILMIDCKVAQWLNDPKMSIYLRPETLFNATKCASYVEESRSKTVQAKGEGKWDI